MHHRARHHPMTQPWPACWATRRNKVKPPLSKYTLRLLAGQNGCARSVETTC